LRRGLDVKPELVPLSRAEGAIVVVRGRRVLLDAHLASLYGVPVKSLNQSVKRNSERFPEDFMFQLTTEETPGRGVHRKYLPFAFTELGVAMLSSVLRSARAVQVNIEIMRAFVHLRDILSANAQLAKKLDALERRHDAQFRIVFDAIRELMALPAPGRRIGFRPER
jgi:phage regulator Rha-like protein